MSSLSSLKPSERTLEGLAVGLGHPAFRCVSPAALERRVRQLGDGEPRVTIAVSSPDGTVCHTYTLALSRTAS
jgi:hypothetical protein